VIGWVCFHVRYPDEHDYTGRQVLPGSNLSMGAGIVFGLGLEQAQLARPDDGFGAVEIEQPNMIQNPRIF